MDQVLLIHEYSPKPIKLASSIIANEPAKQRREAGEAAALKSRAKVQKKARVLVR